MDSSLLTSASALEVLTEDYRTIASNLANANTTGFKRVKNTFMEALRAADFDTSQLPEPVNTVTLGRAGLDFSQGPTAHTGRDLDFAVQGSAFFVLETPEGPLFTRSGAFLLNERRELVTAAGHIVSGESGPIVIPPEAASISVTAKGVISADGASIGALRLVEFEDQSQLVPAGYSAFKHLEGDAGAPAQNAQVLQGFRENSNVQPATELVDLISVMRLYELNLKAISSSDERQQQILRLAIG